MQSAEIVAAVTQLVDVYGERGVGRQQRTGGGEHCWRTLQVQDVDLQFGPVWIPRLPAHLARHTTHRESRGREPGIHLSTYRQILRGDIELADTIGCEIDLRCHRHRSGTRLVERLGQTALDAREIAAERDLPAAGLV